MKTIVLALGGLLMAAISVLLWQSWYQKSMLRHLQQSLAWNDRYNLIHPTQAAFMRHCDRKRKELEKVHAAEDRAAKAAA